MDGVKKYSQYAWKRETTQQQQIGAIHVRYLDLNETHFSQSVTYIWKTAAIYACNKRAQKLSRRCW